MSIRAMNWAMAQRTDGPSAQIVLYVIADSASETGVTIHADPDYIAARSCQSRATVFRRLNELEAAGALSRFKKTRPDGAPIYEIRLHLDRNVDYSGDAPPAVEEETAEVDEALAEQAQSQIETPPPGLTGETLPVAPVRLPESHCCDSITNPSKSPDSPQSPPLSEDRLNTEPIETGTPYQRFTDEYGEGSVRPQRARDLWLSLSEAERDLAIRGARGYRNQRLSTKKKLIDPERFLREPAMWTEFAAATAASVPKLVEVDAESDAGRAWLALHRIGNVAPGSTQAQGRRVFWLKAEIGLSVLALLRAPPEREWIVVEPGSPSLAAWRELVLAQTGKTAQPQRHITGERFEQGKDGKPVFVGHDHRHGLKVPAPFPPRVDGSWPEVDSKSALAKTG